MKHSLYFLEPYRIFNFSKPHFHWFLILTKKCCTIRLKIRTGIIRNNQITTYNEWKIRCFDARGVQLILKIFDILSSLMILLFNLEMILQLASKVED